MRQSTLRPQSPLAVLLVVLCALVGLSSIAAGGEAVERADEVERAYRGFDAARRQQWLRTLLVARTQTAAALVLQPHELRRLQALHERVLVETAAGRRLSSAGIASLLSQLDEYELAAIDALARQLRVTSYDAFRTRRDEYARRLRAAREAQANWQAEGSEVDARPRLIAWLRAAIERTERGAELPPMPELSRAAHSAAVPPGSELSKPDKRPPSGEIADNDRQPPGAGPPVQRPASEPAAGATAARRSFTADEPARRGAQEPVVPKPTAAASVSSVPIPPSSPAANHHGQHATDRGSKPVDAEPFFEKARVNTEELAARIAGHNLALSALVERSRQSKGWSLEEAAAAVGELEDLAVGREDLAVYRGLLSEPERQGCGTLNAADDAVAAVAAQVARLREALARAEASSSTRDQLQKLDALSRRLAALAR